MQVAHRRRVPKNRTHSNKSPLSPEPRLQSLGPKKYFLLFWDPGPDLAKQCGTVKALGWKEEAHQDTLCHPGYPLTSCWPGTIPEPTITPVPMCSYLMEPVRPACPPTCLQLDILRLTDRSIVTSVTTVTRVL